MSACLTAWCDATVGTESVDLPHDTAVYLTDSETGRDEPDVVEGDHCEFTAPLRRDTDATEESTQFVTESLPAVEACVRQLPDTVDTTNTVRLR